jgi:folate-binding protein YgfZ
MNEAAYRAVTTDLDGFGAMLVSQKLLRATGRDRATFLNGQVSNDITLLLPGQVAHACLLNNTGHLVALLKIYVVENCIFIQTDSSRLQTVQETLNRFVVRERVEFTPAGLSVVTVQGYGAEKAVGSIDGSVTGAGTVLVWAYNGRESMLLSNPRYSAAVGFDLIVENQDSELLLADLTRLPGSVLLPNSTEQTLRIEAGIPAWGSELDESVIPLEAGLEYAISFNKGCYMGQEVIARIHSRGHTNRSLVGFRLTSPIDVDTQLTAIGGDKKGQDVGRITSSVVSPRHGPIALGYVRNEYAKPNMELSANEKLATVVPLPFNTR